MREDTARPAVLVIDDSPGFLRVIRAILSSGHPAFAVFLVGTGESALAFLRREPPYEDVPRPAFVVLDFHLPDVSAPELLDVTREHPDLRDIPILVLSQADWAEDEAVAMASGARRFRAKPSDPDDLRDLVVSFWREEGIRSVNPGSRVRSEEAAGTGPRLGTVAPDR